MKKPIIHMDFHPSVKEWTVEQFTERYKGQLTGDEIRHFSTLLGLVNEPVAPEEGVPANPAEDEAAGRKQGRRKTPKDVQTTGDETTD